MNAPTTTIEKRLADAAALVSVVAYRDFPNGFVVVVDRLPAGTVAVSTGSGVELARLYGHGNGRAAVVVDAAKVETWGAPQLDALILHESSHAIVDADRPGIEAALDTLPTATARTATDFIVAAALHPVDRDVPIAISHPLAPSRIRYR